MVSKLPIPAKGADAVHEPSQSVASDSEEGARSLHSERNAQGAATSDDKNPKPRARISSGTAVKNPGKEKEKTSLDDGKKDVSESEPPLQKHDHAAYERKIRNKAIDVINKSKSCTLARLCKDSITGQRTLSVYSKGQKTYIFISYGWDDVTGEWTRILESDPRNVSGLGRHLKFSASGKTCETLKGRVEPGKD